MQNPMTFVIRSTLDPASAIAAGRAEVQSVDRDLALTSVTTLEQLVSDAMGDHRFRTTLLSAFAGVALFLAALGIYGVLAYAVAQRTRELGIRLALGASLRQAMAFAVLPGLTLALVGVIVGGVAARLAASTLRHLVWGVSVADPLTFAAAIGTVLAVSAIAAIVPALRIVRLNPIKALRS
jgi:ABC-type antimicrobial peptide transport system permease subunit